MRAEPPIWRWFWRHALPLAPRQIGSFCICRRPVDVMVPGQNGLLEAGQVMSLGMV
jgi:hypothetical protein